MLQSVETKRSWQAATKARASAIAGSCFNKDEMTEGLSSFPTWVWLLAGVGGLLLAIVGWVVERLFHFASDGLSVGAGAAGVLFSSIPKLARRMRTVVGPWLSSFFGWLLSGVTGIVSGVVSFVFPRIGKFEGKANVELVSRLTGQATSEIQGQIADRADSLAEQLAGKMEPPPTEEVSGI